MPTPEYGNWELIRRFVPYFKGRLRLLTWVMTSAVLLALLELSYPMVTRHILKIIMHDNNLGAVFAWAGVLLAIYLLVSVIQFFQTYYGHKMGVKIELAIRERLFQHLEKLSFKFYDHHRTGVLMSRLLSDLFEITEIANHGPADLLLSAMMFLFSFVMLFPICPALTIMLFLWLPILTAYSIWTRRPMHRAFMALREKTGHFNAFIENNIGGIRIIKSFTDEEYVLERFKERNNEYGNAKINTFKRLALFMGGIGFLTHMTNLSVMAAGAVLICRGQLQVEDLVAFLLYVNLLIQPIHRLMHFVDQFEHAMSGFRRYLEIMDTAPDQVDSPGAQALDAPVGKIQFRNITFGYEPGKDVLNDLSFTLEPGNTLALVGPSGGGKTSICSLIPRFYDPQHGEILLDGVNTANLTIHSLRKNIGIVQQEVFLFAGTFRDNIRIGRPEASEEEIQAAAKSAAIHDFIMTCPGGYDAEVGDHGVLLSGGQRQRLAIARVFLKNPPLLILDEATSALDNRSERLVQQSLNALANGRTTIVVAHRLSTVRNANEILYIDGGKILERGTHDQLMAIPNGYYRQLHDAQPQVLHDA